MVATISAITSGSSRVRYFENYIDSDPELRKLSRWHGLGAVELGLTSPNPCGGFRGMPAHENPTVTSSRD